MGRVGPKSRKVLEHIRDNPGCSKAEAGKGAKASQNSVARVIWLGLVREEQQSSHYRLYLTAEGRQVVSDAD